jgi:hypothetical protein
MMILPFFDHVLLNAHNDNHYHALSICPGRDGGWSDAPSGSGCAETHGTEAVSKDQIYARYFMAI